MFTLNLNTAKNIKEKKKAIKQLHKKLIEVLREIECEEASQDKVISISTEDYVFRLEYTKKFKRFLTLVKPDGT